MKRTVLAVALLGLAACSSNAAARPAPFPQLITYCDVTFPANSLVQPPVTPGPAGFVMDVQISARSGHAYLRTLRILVIAGSTGRDQTVTEHLGSTVSPEVNGRQTVVSFAAPDVGHGSAPGGCQVEGWSS